MLRLDFPPAAPAHQLAADEALLDWHEDGLAPEDAGGALVFWEPTEVFVVVGYANHLATEVNLPACEASGIPVYRRCTGGGTVVQMPGGLNYGLILPIDPAGPTRNISAANEFIMHRNRDAIQALLGQRAIVSVRGHTDLAVAHASAPDALRKVAGNSQRRRKRFLLFHGTFLLNCDLTRIAELLRPPSLQPEYRAGRSHSDFVTNLNLPAEDVKAALARAWQATTELAQPPLDKIDALARGKYATREWNYKF
jgi:lipoate-protein ligase A